MVRIDEARHHNAACRIDLASAADAAQVWLDGKYLLALNEDVGPGEAPHYFVLGPHVWVHRHHGAAANNVAAAGRAGTEGRTTLRCGWTRSE